MSTKLQYIPKGLLNFLFNVEISSAWLDMDGIELPWEMVVELSKGDWAIFLALNGLLLIVSCRFSKLYLKMAE